MATSLDGFIADENGGVDWLNAISSQVTDQEDFGFNKLIGEVDHLVMGRHTFDQVLKMGGWIYGDLPVKVITHRPPPKILPDMGNIEFLAGEAQTLLNAFISGGAKHIYLDGGDIVRQFLALDLIDEIILTQVPTLLGNGLRLFTSALDMDQWSLTNQQLYPNGFIQHTIKRIAVR